MPAPADPPPAAGDPPPPASPTAPVPPARNRRWFWCNLLALAALAPIATWWFQKHLELAFTEVWLIGGGLSLWAFLRAGYGLVETIGEVDPASLSRRALASPETSLVLAVATLALALAWWKTNSFYLEYDGAGADDREFVVQVSHPDGRPFLPELTVGPAAKVAGRAFVLEGEPHELVCRIVRPLNYKPLPCPIGGHEALRIKVPADFEQRVFHLLRIVPHIGLLQELPEVKDQPSVRYELRVEAGGVTHTLPDLRRQTVFAGALKADLPLLMRGHERAEYQEELDSELRAASVDEGSASRIAAKLARRERAWPAFDVKAGQPLRISLRRVERRDGRDTASEVDGFPFDYTVTADKTQTIWMPRLP
jgi:hypothetical protein